MEKEKVNDDGIINHEKENLSKSFDGGGNLISRAVREISIVSGSCERLLIGVKLIFIS